MARYTVTCRPMTVITGLWHRKRQGGSGRNPGGTSRSSGYLAITWKSAMSRNTEKPRVRYAVIGGGQIAQQAFMPGMARASNSTLAALVTGDPQKAGRLATRYNIPAYHYDDLPELIHSGDIDAVYLATPNALHRRYAVPVLEAGLHLMVENPWPPAWRTAKPCWKRKGAAVAG
ncbi:Gfo/Idh/MocA family oxidoreductase [Komagataeibacter rhaeticus]|nr:Gfo/Idh/MocA family oxidoreductase [Komagataeibacter rhaeticus]